MNDAKDALPKIALAFRQGAKPRPVVPLHALCCGLIAALAVEPAHASLFKGDTLDAVADVIAWVALVVGPIVAISVFWLVHILPEKIAEKKQHPQAKAIHTLCLLSLFFGGLLWPIAWLWAYTRPVLYKMAYGTDVGESGHGAQPETEAPAPETDSELPRLRVRKVGEREPTLPIETVTSRERA
jgi:CBS domain containing-hemolysin-like protein